VTGVKRCPPRPQPLDRHRIDGLVGATNAMLDRPFWPVLGTPIPCPCRNRLGSIAHILPVAGSHDHRQLAPQAQAADSVEPDGLPSPDALFRRSLPEPHTVEFSRLRTTSVDRRLGEHGKELSE
jgi:hypothetical protein